MKPQKDARDEVVKQDLYYHSLDEIAKEIGVSRPQAGKILERAIKKFKQGLFKRCIEKDDLL